MSAKINEVSIFFYKHLTTSPKSWCQAAVS